MGLRKGGLSVDFRYSTSILPGFPGWVAEMAEGAGVFRELMRPYENANRTNLAANVDPDEGFCGLQNLTRR